MKVSPTCGNLVTVGPIIVYLFYGIYFALFANNLFIRQFWQFLTISKIKMVGISRSLTLVENNTYKDCGGKSK